MSNSVTYEINLKVVGENIVGQITAEVDKLRQSTEKTTKTFGDCFKSFLAFETAINQFSNLRQSIEDINRPGVTLNSQMAELSAITGVTGDGLKAIETAARQTAKTFGTDASANVESYKLVLSQLDPEIAKNAEAMKMMGDNINILSKQMGGDTVAATNVLTTSMNQFGISTENPIEAAKTMADMMNVMSSAAQAGSAELPQIQSALEQVGMVAKTTGLSFEETNAQIQILDKAGKKGSEGGVALRNVLTTLSEGRFTSKLAAQGLQQAGISVEYLANTSIPLTDRLKTLRKIQGDTALMTKVFGKENMAAAIAMINGADEAEALTEQITGTNSAMDQAEIIMGSYAEKMARTKAWWDDLKISIFNATQEYLPAITKGLDVIDVTGKMFFNINILTSTYNALRTVINRKNIALTINTIKLKLASLWSGILRVKTIALTFAQRVLGVSLALVGTAFGHTASRQKLMAFWTDILAMKTKLLTFAQGALNAVMNMNPIGLIIIGITALIALITVAISKFDSFGSTILLLLGPIGWLISGFMLIHRHWNSIVAAFKSDGIIGALKRLGLVLLDVIMHPLQRILSWVGKLTNWKWVKSIAGSVEEFRGRMNLITVNESKDKANEPQEVKLVETPFDLKKNTPKTSTLGGLAVQTTEKGKGVGEKSDSGNRVRNLNIGKMMDNFNIYMNTASGIDKTQLLQAVREVLLTATADFAGVNP